MECLFIFSPLWSSFFFFTVTRFGASLKIKMTFSGNLFSSCLAIIWNFNNQCKGIKPVSTSPEGSGAGADQHRKLDTCCVGLLNHMLFICTIGLYCSWLYKVLFLQAVLIRITRKVCWLASCKMRPDSVGHPGISTLYQDILNLLNVSGILHIIVEMYHLSVIQFYVNLILPWLTTAVTPSFVHTFNT